MSMTLNMERPALKEAARAFRSPPIDVGARVLCKKASGQRMIAVVTKVHQSCLSVTESGRGFTAYHKDDPRLIYSTGLQNDWQWEYTTEYLREKDYYARVEALERYVDLLLAKVGLPERENKQAAAPNPVVQAEPATTTPQVGPHDVDMAQEVYDGLTDDQLRELLLSTPGVVKQGVNTAKRETLVRKLIEAGTPTPLGAAA